MGAGGGWERTGLKFWASEAAQSRGYLTLCPAVVILGAAELLGSGPPGCDDRPSAGTVIAELKLLIFFLAGRS